MYRVLLRNLVYDFEMALITQNLAPGAFVYYFKGDYPTTPITGVSDTMVIYTDVVANAFGQ
jgi:hypothetical protein